MPHNDAVRYTASTYDGHRHSWLARLGSVTGGRFELRDWAVGSEAAKVCYQASVPLPPDVRRKLSALVGDAPIGLLTVACAAFAWLLHRYSGRTDVVIMTPPVRETDLMPAADLLPLVIPQDRAGCIRDLLRTARDVVLDACQHQDFPLDDLQSSLGLGVGPPSMALVRHAGLHSELPPDDRIGLRLEIGLRDESITLAGSASFRPAFVDTMAHHLARVMAECTEPDARLDAIQPLSDAELQRLLCDFASGGGVPPTHGIITPFARQVAATPDAIAIVDRDQSLTYRELGRRAWAVAAGIKRAHSGAPGLCALYGPPCSELVVGMLGILMAGHGYVPIDPTLPQARLAALIEATRPVVLVTTEPNSPPFTGPVVATFPHPGGDAMPALADTAQALAYVLFTSGSTGAPKGVVVERGAVARLVRETNYLAQRAPALGDRVLQWSSPTFDGSVFDVFVALLNGATLVIAPAAVRREADRLCNFIREQAITIGFISTGMFNVMVEHDPAVTGCFDLLLFGGQDAAPASVRAAWHQAARPGSLVHVYGPTEAATFATYYPVLTIGADDSFIPIGRPLSNTTIYVLDPWMRPLPVGVAGEIHIGGPGVARGYLNDAANMSMSPFLADPFRPGGRLYRTGDRGCWLPDGNLRFLGRLDDQVKIRGFRVDPGEIESAIRECPGVREAALMVRESAGEKELVAYIVPNTSPANLAEVRSQLAARLPEYMVPNRILSLRQLPISVSGKVDRKALPDPDAGDPRDLMSATTETEQRVLGLWRRLFGRTAIGLDDDFFDLGGHSLKAARLSVEMQREFQTTVSVASVLQHTTPRRLAGAMAGQTLEPLPQAPAQAYHPLTPAQRGIHSVLQVGPAAASSYNIPEAFDVDGPIDPAALRQAITHLLRRHEALRARFRVADGAVQQIFDDPPLLMFEDVDLAGDAADESRLDDVLRQRGLAPFDLRFSPPLRVLLVTLGPRRHVLLLTFHHIAVDGWSVGLLLRELAECYQAITLGKAPLPPPLTRTLRDYIHWRKTWLEGPQAATAHAYWMAKMVLPVAAIELPADAPRPTLKSFRGSRATTSLGHEVTAAARRLARENKATLFMVLITAVKVLMHRYSRETDIVVGTPMATRDNSELTAVAGLLVDLVPLRDRVDPDGAFIDLLNSVRDTVIEAQQHRLYPLERMLEELGVARSPDRTPLFDIVVTMSNSSFAGPSPGSAVQIAEDLTLRKRPPAYDVSRFDLTFAFDDAEDIGLDLEFSTDLFTRSRIVRMIGHLGQLILAAERDPRKPLGELDMLRSIERAHLDAIGDGGPAPAGSVLPKVFAWAAADPERPAVIAEGRRLSFGALAALADGIAATLAKRDVAGQVIALMAPRRAWTVAALLGIWRVGATCLPIDERLPPERAAALIADAGAELILGETTGLSAPSGRTPPSRSSSPALPAADLAYIIYTSGSTGGPNGVLVQHRALANWILDQAQRLRLGPEDTVLHGFSFGFDPALFFSLLALVSGAPVVIASEGESGDPSQLATLIRDHRVRVLGATPSLLREFDALALEGVHTLVTGGEILDPALVRRLGVGRRWVNQYGSTECTCVTSHVIEDARLPHGSVPVGKPIGGVSVHVLDERLQAVPLGHPGEVCVAGNGLAFGYVDASARAMQNFVTISDGTTRLYRTGDNGRWRDDGRLEFLGRRDDLIKVRGFRVNLGDIDRALLSCAGVTAAASLADGDQLLAFVVGGVDAAALSVALTRLLPRHMVPDRLVSLPAMPLTANAKPDRSALLAFARRRPAIAELAPGYERELAALWQDLLKVTSIGSNDDFFALGGNSLLAAALVARLRSSHSIDLSVRDVFESPTLLALAATIIQRRANGDVLPAFRRRGDDEPPRPSHAQHRIWVAERAAPQPGLFNSCSILRLEGMADLAALRTALARLAARHEPLHTCVRLCDGDLSLTLQPDVPPTLRILDLSAHPDPTAALYDKAQDEARTPFDLAAEAPLRVTLTRLHEWRSALVVTIHHIAADGWSMGVFTRELAELYQTARDGRPSSLPPLPVRYRDYAAWHRDVLGAAEGTRLRNYWRAKLASPLPASTLPPDRPRRSRGGHAGAVVGLDLPAATVAAMDRLGSLEGATRFMTLLAAFGALIHAHTRTAELVLGFPSAGRPLPDMAGLIGNFTNPIPLRFSVDATEGMRSLTKTVRQACLEALDHQLYPFDLMVKDAQPPRREDSHPFFDVGVTWTRADAASAECADIFASCEEVATYAKHAFWLHATEHAGGLRLDAEYRTALYDAASAARHLSDLAALIDAAGAAPDVPIHELAMFVIARHLSLESTTRYRFDQ
jgi:amino acid adenylation domain-containing protein